MVQTLFLLFLDPCIVSYLFCTLIWLLPSQSGCLTLLILLVFLLLYSCQMKIGHINLSLFFPVPLYNPFLLFALVFLQGLPLLVCFVLLLIILGIFLSLILIQKSSLKYLFLASVFLSVTLFLLCYLL